MSEALSHWRSGTVRIFRVATARPTQMALRQSCRTGPSALLKSIASCVRSPGSTCLTLAGTRSAPTVVAEGGLAAQRGCATGGMDSTPAFQRQRDIMCRGALLGNTPHKGGTRARPPGTEVVSYGASSAGGWNGNWAVAWLLPGLYEIPLQLGIHPHFAGLLQSCCGGCILLPTIPNGFHQSLRS